MMTAKRMGTANAVVTDAALIFITSLSGKLKKTAMNGSHDLADLSESAEHSLSCCFNQ